MKAFEIGLYPERYFEELGFLTATFASLTVQLLLRAPFD
jgi:hypothetical protein